MLCGEIYVGLLRVVCQRRRQRQSGARREIKPEKPSSSQSLSDISLCAERKRKREKERKGSFAECIGSWIVHIWQISCDRKQLGKVSSARGQIHIQLPIHLTEESLCRETQWTCLWNIIDGSDVSRRRRRQRRKARMAKKVVGGVWEHTSHLRSSRDIKSW